jgi:hypothetical protein
MTSRVTVTLRRPSSAEAELVVTVDGEAVVYPLNSDQLKLLAVQAVRAVCNWPGASGAVVRSPPSKLDLRDDIQRDYDEEREHGWSVP